MKVAQSCLTLCDLVDYTVHGILQARILEWVAFPSSRGSSQPSNQTQVSRTAGRFFTSWATREICICDPCNIYLCILCHHRVSSFPHLFDQSIESLMTVLLGSFSSTCFLPLTLIDPSSRSPWRFLPLTLTLALLQAPVTISISVRLSYNTLPEFGFFSALCQPVSFYTRPNDKSLRLCGYTVSVITTQPCSVTWEQI